MEIDIWKIASRWDDRGDPNKSVYHLFKKYSLAFVNKDDAYETSEHIDNGGIALLAIADGHTIRAIGEVEKVGVVSDFAKNADLKSYSDILCFKLDFYELNDNETFTFAQPKMFAHIDNIDVFDKVKELYLQKKGIKQMNDYLELLKSNKNMILTGAPGTGKTYLAYQIVTEIILTNFESFLNNYQFETKGVIGPLTDDTKRQYLVALKQIPIDLRITLTEFFIKSNTELNAIKERYLINGDLKDSDKNGNKSAVIGKLIELNPSQFFSFVQFHPSYDYSDFVEGLRPKKEKDSKEIGFELKNGIFKQFCIIAKSNPDYDFIFIIDEINRGEISKIFGELFFSMDPGYRGEKGKVKTQFANMQTKDTFFTNIDDDYFYIPERVYIIGTMNDIDRSVESFDFAMRRRFVWKEIKAEATQNMLETLEYADKRKIDIMKTRMNNLNIIISKTEELGPHYNIGAAYFLKLANYNGDIDKLWELHLEPLLSEYLRGLPDVKDKLEKMKNAYKTETPIDEKSI